MIKVLFHDTQCFSQQDKRSLQPEEQHFRKLKNAGQVTLGPKAVFSDA